MSKRIEQLDVIRSIAIVLVVITHAVEIKYNISDLSFMNSIGTVSRIFAVACLTVGRLGVPLFLLLTGYLVMSRSYGDDGRKKFYKRNLLPFILTAEVWVVLLNIFACWFYESDFDIKLLIRQMLFLDDLSMVHLWYLPMILGIYLFVPFVADAFRKIKTKAVVVPMAVIIILLFVMPYINALCIINDEPQIYTRLDLSFSGGAYGVYLILGILLSRKFLKKANVFLTVFVGTASLIAGIMIQFYFLGQDYAYSVWYNSIFILISAVALFEVVMRIDRVRLSGLFRSLSRCSFGIYLLHLPIMFLMDKYLIDGTALRTSYKSFLLMISALLISWCVVYVVGKIPHVRKVLFFIK